MAKAFETSGVIPSLRAQRRNPVMRIWIAASASGLLAMTPVYAQTADIQPLTEQQKFLVGCNPQNKAELQKACACLLENIEVAFTIKAFNELELREREGELSALELDQKSQLLAGRKAMIQACMKR